MITGLQNSVIGYFHDDFERIWWRLFQKRVVRTKFDILVFIALPFFISPLNIDTDLTLIIKYRIINSC